MAWTSPITFVALVTSFTAAIWNTYVRDNLNYLYGLLTHQRISANVTSAATSGTGEDDLMTYSLPAGTLSANGMSVDIVAFGTRTGTAGNKTEKLYFGATAVAQTDASTAASDWELRATVFRTAAATQVAVGTRIRGVGGSYGTYYTAPAETLSGAVTIKATGECANAGDTITQYGMRVTLVP